MEETEATEETRGIREMEEGGGIGKMVMEETGEMEEKVVMMYRPPNRTTHHVAGSRASSGSAFVFFAGARQLGM